MLISLYNGPVYTAGAAVFGQQGRMIADGSDSRDIYQYFGYDIGDERQDHQIRIQLEIGFPDFGIFHLVRAKKSEAGRFCGRRHGVTYLMIGAKNPNNFLTFFYKGV
jgi:hypothetical protein